MYRLRPQVKGSTVPLKRAFFIDVILFSLARALHEALLAHSRLVTEIPFTSSLFRITSCRFLPVRTGRCQARRPPLARRRALTSCTASPSVCSPGPVSACLFACLSARR